MILILWRSSSSFHLFAPPFPSLCEHINPSYFKVLISNLVIPMSGSLNHLYLFLLSLVLLLVFHHISCPVSLHAYQFFFYWMLCILYRIREVLDYYIFLQRAFTLSFARQLEEGRGCTPNLTTVELRKGCTKVW